MQRGPRACPRPHVVGKAGGPAGDSRKLYPFEQRRNNSETNLHRSRKGANGKREVVRLRFCAARKAFSGLRRRRGRVKGADRSNRPRPRATSARGGIARGFFWRLNRMAGRHMSGAANAPASTLPIASKKVREGSCIEDCIGKTQGYVSSGPLRGPLNLTEMKSRNRTAAIHVVRPGRLSFLVGRSHSDGTLDAAFCSYETVEVCFADRYTLRRTAFGSEMPEKRETRPQRLFRYVKWYSKWKCPGCPVMFGVRCFARCST